MTTDLKKPEAPARVDDCSYCERPTGNPCPECVGCDQCCPPEHRGTHCETCGQSLLKCAATYCGGQRGFL